MSKKKFRLKFADLIIILIALSITFYSAFFVYIKREGETQVLIRGQGSEWVFPLDADETVLVGGVLGNTVVRIHGGNAWVESSPCDNQNCVAMGSLTRQGQWAACLPNNVLLIIQGKEEEELDALTW